MNDFGYELSLYIEEAIKNPNRNLIRRIRRLWDNEKWESIKRKFLLVQESSMWIVWWYDGVNKFSRRQWCK